ncbi:MAG: hypothetical protein KDI71_09755, partial [Xanthomonadales bacterium]|nr:hypothetical protein [Xanthomonadales bacterium]
PFDLDAAKQKYQPLTPRAVGIYALAQFALTIVATTALLAVSPQLSMSALILACAWVILTLSSLAGLLEGRLNWATEYLRLGALVPVLALDQSPVAMAPNLLRVVLVVIALSLFHAKRTAAVTHSSEQLREPS